MTQHRTYSALHYINLIQTLSETFMKRNCYYIIARLFIHYVLHKLRRSFTSDVSVVTLPDKTLQCLIKRYRQNVEEYIDDNSCILTNVKSSDTNKTNWYYICCTKTFKKYKVYSIPFSDVCENTIFISETIRHNMEHAFGVAEPMSTCCLLRLEENVVDFATEIRVSMISSPHECPSYLTDVLLQNYFSVPRFLRLDDTISIETKEYAEDQIYCSAMPLSPTVYFKVKGLKFSMDNIINAHNGGFVVRGETALIQEANVNSFLPYKHIEQTILAKLHLNERINNCIANGHYPFFMESVTCIKNCILPFITSDINLCIKPIIHISGPPGSAKSKIVQICAESIGLNLLTVDFTEVQTLTPAQTEAKIRIVLRNAEQSVPCMLCLKNIQVFGKTSEGQKDERIISTFSTEINALYKKNLEFPLVIVVTSDGSDVSAELQRMFIETVHIEHLNQDRRVDLLSQLLTYKRLNYETDLSRVAALCSDFRYTDLTALISCAVKNHCKTIERIVQNDLTLIENNFNRAYDYIRSICLDNKDTPHIPKVYWEDIGGLEELQYEITQRIQLSLLNVSGFEQSGLLLYGPPGTGKTLLAKAVATEYQLHFLSIKGPEVLNMYVGQSEKNVRQIFEKARASAPCIIFFDELDSLAPNRGRSGDSGGVMDRVVSQLLSEMDGLEESGNIFIIGATNRPDLIDPALLRPGRLNKMLYVGVHSKRSSQLGVLKALTRKFKFLEGGSELEKVANELPDHVSGADLYAVASEAWLYAVRRILHDRDFQKRENEPEDVVVQLPDLLKAVQNLVPSISKADIERYKRMQTDLMGR